MMKKKLLLSGVVATSVLLTACGGSHQRTVAKPVVNEQKPAEENVGTGNAQTEGTKTDDTKADAGTNDTTGNSGSGSSSSSGSSSGGSYGGGYHGGGGHYGGISGGSSSSSSSGSGSSTTTPPSSVTATSTVTVAKVSDIKKVRQKQLDDNDKLYLKQKLDKLRITVGDEYKDSDKLDLVDVQKGFGEHKYYEAFETVDEKDKDKYASYERKGSLYLFNQEHSAVGLIDYEQTGKDQDKKDITLPAKDKAGKVSFMTGKATLEKDLPSKGQFKYEGGAYMLGGSNDTMPYGAFSYEIDFANKKGSGKIVLPKNLKAVGGGTDHTITLKTQELKKQDLSGYFGDSKAIGVVGSLESDVLKDGVDKNSQYRLALFGEKAEEVVGDFTLFGKDKTTGNEFSYQGVFGGAETKKD